LGHGRPHDLVVVEREVGKIVPPPPPSLGGVVAAHRGGAGPLDAVDDARGRSAGVASGVRVHADEPDHPAPEAGLLPEFADDRLLGRFGRLDEPARERPAAPERLAAAEHEEHRAPREPDRVDREFGAGGVVGHPESAIRRGR
jgi:hypothetical protein